MKAPIGIFDSGYGGLTVMREILKELPQYDYIYLGDNARAPYGTRSFDLVYKFTLEAVRYLFAQGCPLVILACNTASAKALRSIQQRDLPHIDESRRVLGVIRPTVEVLGNITKSRHVGVLATQGTVASESYILECEKLFPDIAIYQQACPMWVQLIENGEHESPGADYFVDKYIGELLVQSPDIDTILLGCTHYPLLIDKIRQRVPQGITIISQGEYVARSLHDYLNRHTDMQQRLSTGGHRLYLTTDTADKFSPAASIFMGADIKANQITL